jgi:hypothetical protein
VLIYKITNKVNGKSYIGQTRKSLMDRARQWRHDASVGLNYLLPTAIREFGWENFEATVIVQCHSQEEMHTQERTAIALFNTLHPNGYNKALGGPGLSGREVSAETRAKISAANMGRKPAKLTPDGYARMVASRTGAKNYRARAIEYRGVVHPSIVDAAKATGLSRGQIESRLRKGIATYLSPPHPSAPKNNGMWNRGRKLTPEHLAKRVAGLPKGANHYRSRQVEMDGAVYSSGVAAMAATGLSRMQLRIRLKNGTARYLTESRFVH